MAKQITEDENNLKRRARRRLIGAVALALVVVVVLPMLLDSEPKQTGQQDIELRIPDKDKVGEFAPKMAMPSAPVAASAVDISSPDPAASQAVAVPTQASGSPPANKTISEEKTQPVAQSGFVVQIGSFAHADAAHNLQQKLKKSGIKTYTEKVDDKTRVRAGPYATREAADKVRRKLEAQGLKPVVSSVY